MCSRVPELKRFVSSLRRKPTIHLPLVPTKVEGINVGSLNVQSLKRAKRTGVIEMMRQARCEILCLQETWKQCALTVKNLSGMTYHSIGFQRESIGRGIGIIVNPLLNFRIEASLCLAIEAIEILTIKAPDGGLISNVYVPPNSSHGITVLSDTVSAVPPSYPYWFIIGDFNANHKNWSNGTPNQNGSVP